MEWNSKYNWQPIPVFSQQLDEDTVRQPINNDAIIGLKLIYTSFHLIVNLTPRPNSPRLASHYVAITN